MNIITIPAYSYFTNDPKAYRTDECIMSSSAFIQRMIEEHPTITSTSVTTYSYHGSAVKTDAYKLVNGFFNESLMPYLGIPYHALYQSDFLPTDPSHTAVWYNINHFYNVMGLKSNFFRVDDTVVPGSGYTAPEKTVALNNSRLHDVYVGGITSTTKYAYNCYSGSAYSVSVSFGATTWTMVITGYIFPDNIFGAESLNPMTADTYGMRYNITITYDPSVLSPGVTDIVVTMECNLNYNWTDLDHVYHDFLVKGSGMSEKNDDKDDPYDDDGESGTGGGDGGGGGGWIDGIDGPGIPALPTINVCDLGLITMYNPSEAQVKSLSSFLWSGAFDLNTYKKLFTDPMDGLIGLSIVPVSPSIGGTQNVKIGNVDSGIAMDFLSSNWKEIDCGWLAIEKFVGCFMDGDPYTKIQIYLPFIGIRPLSADDINGGSIHVVYHVDVLTGACAAFIEHSVRGVLYTYNGSCITNVPLTAINFSGAIQNAVSAVVSGIGMVAGAATGAAPITAMGATGLLNSAANTAINSKPNIQRSGNLGGSAGILSILTPYVIIERPKISMPSNMNKLIGNTSNITYKLSALKGFTMVEYIHVENCEGTSEEIAEIESLLKQGVYL